MIGSMCWQPVASAAEPVAAVSSTAAVTAPQRVWPITSTSFAPATAQPYSDAPEHLPPVMLPAMRTLKMSPTPRSKISSVGRPRVDATEHHGQRVLAGGRGADLPAQVARQPPAGAEPLVAVLQDLQHLGRRQGALQVAGGVVHVLDLVAELVLAAEADQAHFDAAGRPRLLLEVADQAEDVRVDVVGVAGVEQDVAAGRHLVEHPVECGPVQEAHLVGQFDAAPRRRRGASPTTRRSGPAGVAPQDEADAHRQPDQDADQQVGQDDGQPPSRRTGRTGSAPGSTSAARGPGWRASPR